MILFTQVFDDKSLWHRVRVRICLCSLLTSFVGFGIKCVRDRSPSFSEFQRFAGKRAPLRLERLQDFFHRVSEELPDGGVFWEVFVRESEHACAGHRLVQHPAGREAARAAQLHLAGERAMQARTRWLLHTFTHTVMTENIM